MSTNNYNYNNNNININIKKVNAPRHYKTAKERYEEVSASTYPPLITEIKAPLNSHYDKKYQQLNIQNISNKPLVEPFMSTIPPLQPYIPNISNSPMHINKNTSTYPIIKLVDLPTNDIDMKLNNNSSSSSISKVDNHKNSSNTAPSLANFIGKNFSNPNFNIPPHDKNQLMLPIRLFIKINNRESPISAKDVNAQLGPLSNFLYNLKPLESEDNAPNHVEVLAFYKEGGNILRSLVVYGQMDQIGCMFNSASATASCCKGWNARNSIVYLDRDFTKTLESVLENVVNNPEIAKYPNFHEYLLLNKEFRDFSKISPFAGNVRDSMALTYTNPKSNLIEARFPVLRLPLKEAAEFAEKLTQNELGLCSVCFLSTNEDEACVICCDDCNREYHFNCLTPPIVNIDDIVGDWICFKCDANIAPVESPSPLPVLKTTRPYKKRALNLTKSSTSATTSIKPESKSVEKVEESTELRRSQRRSEYRLPSADEVLQQNFLQRYSKRLDEDDMMHEFDYETAPFWWSSEVPLSLLPSNALQPIDWSAPFLELVSPSKLESICIN